MKHITFAFAAAMTAATSLAVIPVTASADDDFHGVVEQRPAGKAGTWVIGGRTLQADDRVELDEGDGRIEVGSCVEVDFDDGRVEEIERERDSKCKRS